MPAAIPRRLPPTPEERLRVLSSQAQGKLGGATRWAKPVTDAGAAQYLDPPAEDGTVSEPIMTVCIRGRGAVVPTAGTIGQPGTIEERLIIETDPLTPGVSYLIEADLMVAVADWSADYYYQTSTSIKWTGPTVAEGSYDQVNDCMWWLNSGPVWTRLNAYDDYLAYSITSVAFGVTAVRSRWVCDVNPQAPTGQTISLYGWSFDGTLSPRYFPGSFIRCTPVGIAENIGTG
jgi:hypothetical protein